MYQWKFEKKSFLIWTNRPAIERTVGHYWNIYCQLQCKNGYILLLSESSYFLEYWSQAIFQTNLGVRDPIPRPQAPTPPPECWFMSQDTEPQVNCFDPFSLLVVCCKYWLSCWTLKGNIVATATTVVNFPISHRVLRNIFVLGSTYISSGLVMKIEDLLRVDGK